MSNLLRSAHHRKDIRAAHDCSRGTGSPVVAIGGVGGSGTRVVAQILINQGFYLGSDLNRANDNLWFTLLFKRPDWFLRNAGNTEVISTALRIFSRAMLGVRCGSVAELSFIAAAAFRISTRGNSHVGDGRGVWPLLRAWKMTVPPAWDDAKYSGWGWKEPNSHIYLKYLNAYFERFKFIHVVRHGLDMAYGAQQHQLFNWGPLYDVVPPADPALVPRAALSYWVRANEQAIALGREMGEEKFLLLNFDDLCNSPAKEIDRICRFLNRNPGKADREKLCRLVKPPSTMGRYRRHDLSKVDPRDVEAVRRLGFPVEESI